MAPDTMLQLGELGKRFYAAGGLSCREVGEVVTG